MGKYTANGTLKLDNQTYERELKRLQAELVTMQQWIIETGSRLVVIFEGRDAAGKGSAIKRMSEYLNPRHARISALPAPTERQKTQWYFQRYVEQLPAGGEIVMFDRSWYNRAGVERVMGFCSDTEYARFLRQCPSFERMLIDDGIMLRKYWFSVSDIEQEARFRSRANDPMRRWKLSPMDMQSITRWEDYSRAKDTMMQFTDLADSPWYTVESEDKKSSRINVIAHLLSTVPYQQRDPLPVEIPHRPDAVGYLRPPRESNRYVPDVAHFLERLDAEGGKGKGKHGKDKNKKGKKARKAAADAAVAAVAAAAPPAPGTLPAELPDPAVEVPHTPVPPPSRPARKAPVRKTTAKVTAVKATTAKTTTAKTTAAKTTTRKATPRRAAASAPAAAATEGGSATPSA